jgi:hypothetical protein
MCILCLDNLVILRTDGTDDGIFDATGQHTFDDEVQNTEFGRKKLSCPRPTAFDKAFKVEALLKKSVNVGLHNGMIERIIAEAASDPHGT